VEFVGENSIQLHFDPVDYSDLQHEWICLSLAFAVSRLKKHQQEVVKQHQKDGLVGTFQIKVEIFRGNA
jgi:hypothetical protein